MSTLRGRGGHQCSGTRSSRTACRGGGVAPGWPGTTDNRPRYVTHVGQMSVSYNH